MQLIFIADITNDHDEDTLAILDDYVPGAKPAIPFRDRVNIPTTTTQEEHVALFVTPVVREAKQDFTTRVILIDQFKRKHWTDKVTFRWAGGSIRAAKTA